MALSYTTTLRNNRMDEVTTLIDADVGAGSLRIYAGTPPASVNAALSGNTLLAQLPLTDPAAGAAASGLLTFSAITDDSSADATGTASFFRLLDNSGDAVVQGTAGTSGTDLILDTASITAGQTVSVTSATITEGNA